MSEPQDPWTHEFDDREWEACRKIASGRSSRKESWGRRFDPPTMSNKDDHFIGVVAEATVALYYGVKIDRTGHDGDGHMADITAFGVGVEVKGTIYSPPHLKICYETDFRSQYAAVVHVDLDKREAAFWGIVSKHKFLRDAYHRDYGYGDRLVMEPPFDNPETLKGPPAV